MPEGGGWPVSKRLQSGGTKPREFKDVRQDAQKITQNSDTIKLIWPLTQVHKKKHNIQQILTHSVTKIRLKTGKF